MNELQIDLSSVVEGEYKELRSWQRPLVMVVGSGLTIFSVFLSALVGRLLSTTRNVPLPNAFAAGAVCAALAALGVWTLWTGVVYLGPAPVQIGFEKDRIKLVFSDLSVREMSLTSGRFSMTIEDDRADPRLSALGSSSLMETLDRRRVRLVLTPPAHDYIIELARSCGLRVTQRRRRFYLGVVTRIRSR